MTNYCQSSDRGNLSRNNLREPEEIKSCSSSSNMDHGSALRKKTDPDPKGLDYADSYGSEF